MRNPKRPSKRDRVNQQHPSRVLVALLFLLNVSGISPVGIDSVEASSPEVFGSSEEPLAEIPLQQPSPESSVPSTAPSQQPTPEASPTPSTVPSQQPTPESSPSPSPIQQPSPSPQPSPSDDQTFNQSQPMVTITGGPVEGAVVGPQNFLVDLDVGETNVNHQPRVPTQNVTTASETAVLIPSQASDPDGDTLTVSIRDFPSGQGSAVMVDSQTVEYTPAAGFNRRAAFFALVADNKSIPGRAIQPFNVDVAPMAGGLPPVVIQPNLSTSFEEGLSFSIASSASDPEGGPLTFDIRPPLYGSMTASGGQVTFTPRAGFSGKDFIPFYVRDSAGNTTAEVAVITVGSPDITNVIVTANAQTVGSVIPLVGFGGKSASITLGGLGFPDGPITVEFVATDAAGRSASATRNYNLDQSPPHQCEYDDVVTPLEDSFVSGNINFKLTANDALSGIRTVALIDPRNLTLLPYDRFLNTSEWQTRNAYDTVGLADGTYAFKSFCVDNAGQFGNQTAVGLPSATRNLKVDNTAPTGTLTIPHTVYTENGQTRRLVTGTRNVSVTAADGTGSGVKTIKLFLDGILLLPAVNGNSLTYGLNTLNYPDGTHVLRAELEDNKGHISNLAPITLTFDKTPPSISITSPLNGDLVASIGHIDAIVVELNGIQSLTMTHAVDGGAADPLPFTRSNNTFTFSTINSPGLHTFALTAVDTIGNSSQASITVQIDGSPNTPPLALNQAVDTDEDVARAVTLTGFDPEGVTPLNFTVMTPPAHGNLSGTAPNLTYTPNANMFGPDSFTFKVNDGVFDSLTDGTVSINVNPVNDIPVANAGSRTTDENTATSVALSATDVDGDALAYLIVTPPAYGVLTGSGAARTYTPNANFNGSDSFSFRVNDGTVLSNIATVSLTVTSINSIPMAHPKIFSTLEDAAKSFTLTGSDVETPITFSIVTGPSKGSLSGTPPNLTYTPNLNANGSDSFTFKVNDGMVDSPAATVSINIVPVNDAPTTVVQLETIGEDQAHAITLNGVDVDGDSLSFIGMRQPIHGTLSAGVARIKTYTPHANYFGPDSFTFKANDGYLDSNVSVVNIDVAPANDNPVAHNQMMGIIGDVAHAITLTATDIDDDVLNYTVMTGPLNGTLSGSAPNLMYTRNAGFTGTDLFTFKANDGTADSNIATINLDMSGTRLAPEANSQSLSLNEDVAVAITLTGNTNPAGDPLTFNILTNPAHGTLLGSLPNLMYTPHANYSGPDSFTFKVNDGSLDSDVAMVSITVNSVNDQPVANSQSLATPEDIALAISLIGTDVDGDPLSTIIVAGPSRGTLSGSDAAFTYTPNAGLFGMDSFTFVVNDGSVDSDPVTVSINVISDNDDPVANNGSATMDEDTAANLNLSVSDADGEPLTHQIVIQPAHGTLSGLGANPTYTPNANFYGSDSFTFKANDGITDSNTATFTLIISPVNDAPVAVARTLSAEKNKSKNFSVEGTDPDGDGLTFDIISGPTHGLMTISVDGTNWVYTPTSNYMGSDSFSFKVNDGIMDSAPALVSITVVNVNTPPQALPQTVTLDEDTPKSIVLVATDADGNTPTYSIVSPPVRGTLGGTAPNLIYTPNADYTGSDTFTFKANDGLVDSNVATVSLTINPINDAPRVTFLSPADNGTVTNTVLVQVHVTDDSGYLGPDLTIDGNPVSATDNGNGNFTYSWNTDVLTEGNHQLVFGVEDDTGAVTQETVNIWVDNTNPVVESFSPANDTTVSENVQIVTNYHDNQGLVSAKLIINGVEVASQSHGFGEVNGSLSFSWGTSNLPNGVYNVEVLIADRAGRFSSQMHQVNLQNGSTDNQAPQIAVLFPIVASPNPTYLAGFVTLRMRVTPANTPTVTMSVDNQPNCATVVPQPALEFAEYVCTFNTTNNILFPGPSHTLHFTASNSLGSDAETISAVFDNTSPVVTVTRPNNGQVFYLTQVVTANILDANLDFVRFTYTGQNGSVIAFINSGSSPFTHMLDTLAVNELGRRIFPDGEQVILKVEGQDKAGNLTVVNAVFIVDQSQAPVSTGTVVWTPAQAFVVNAAVSATISGVGFDINSITNNSLQIFIDKDGLLNQRVPGTVIVNGPAISFMGAIPDNCVVRAVLNILDSAGAGLSTTHTFTNAMDKTRGGIVKTSGDELNLSIPANALTDHTLVVIEKVIEPSQNLLEADASSQRLNGNHIVVFGPVDFIATTENGSRVKKLLIPALLSWFRPPGNIPPGQGNFIDQFQQEVGGVWEGFADSAGNGQVSLAASAPTARTINAPIQSLGYFRVTSFALPSSGLSEFFNFPNPFSPMEGETQLHYLLGADSQVQIVIYDLFGNLVKKMEISAGQVGGKIGQNILRWDGRNGEGDVVANGGYIVQVHVKDPSGSESKSIRKIAVIK